MLPQPGTVRPRHPGLPRRFSLCRNGRRRGSGRVPAAARAVQGAGPPRGVRGGELAGRPRHHIPRARRMIAVDTNILVYAHREDSPWHAPAVKTVMGLAEGRAPWAIVWPCLHEFLAIVTHPRIYRPPTPAPIACKQVDAWLESPSLVLLAETDEYWKTLRGSVLNGRIAGPLVHDARVACLCLVHGVDELWTQDRDFGRFPWLKTINPL